MRYFCTYFDSRFLPRALALRESLARRRPEFHLWGLCLDAEGCAAGRRLGLPGLVAGAVPGVVLCPRGRGQVRRPEIPGPVARRLPERPRGPPPGREPRPLEPGRMPRERAGRAGARGRGPAPLLPLLQLPAG